MSNADLLKRITIDPEICHGKPCIRGLRYPVEFVLELMSSGMNFSEILEDYEDLETEDLQAALSYAAQLTLMSMPIGLEDIERDKLPSRTVEL